MQTLNKKGQLGEQIMIFVFIFFLVIIGGGIVIGTLLFFGNNIDYRGAEASMVAFKIKQCMLEGKVSTILKGENEQMLSMLADRCNLRKEVVLLYNRIRICTDLKDVNSCILAGDKNKFLTSDGEFNVCDKQFASKNQGLEQCFSEIFNYHNTQIVILVTDRQSIRRAS